MRHTIKYGLPIFVISIALGAEVQADDNPRRPPPITIPNPGTPVQVPGPNAPPIAEPFRGPNVDLTVSVNGDGAVRWGPQLCAPKATEGNKICQSTAKKASKLEFSADARPGWTFVRWTGACEQTVKPPVDGQNYFGGGIKQTCTVYADQALTVGADFKVADVYVPKVQIWVKVPYPGGVVSGVGHKGTKIDCQYKPPKNKTNYCNMTVEKGTQVTLTRTVWPGSKFFSWDSTMPGCSKTSGDGCTFKAEQATTVTANFGKESSAGGNTTPPKEKPPILYTVTVRVINTKTETIQISGDNGVWTYDKWNSKWSAKVPNGKLKIYGSIIYSNGTPSRPLDNNEWSGCNKATDQYCEIEVKNGPWNSIQATKLYK